MPTPLGCAHPCDLGQPVHHAQRSERLLRRTKGDVSHERERLGSSGLVCCRRLRAANGLGKQFLVSPRRRNAAVGKHAARRGSAAGCILRPCPLMEPDSRCSTPNSVWRCSVESSWGEWLSARPGFRLSSRSTSGCSTGRWSSAPVEGTKLNSAIWNAGIAFEADAVNSVFELGWSVMIVGRAEEVVDPSRDRRDGADGTPSVGSRFSIARHKNQGDSRFRPTRASPKRRHPHRAVDVSTLPTQSETLRPRFARHHPTGRDRLRTRESPARRGAGKTTAPFAEPRRSLGH